MHHIEEIRRVLPLRGGRESGMRTASGLPSRVRQVGKLPGKLEEREVIWTMVLSMAARSASPWISDLELNAEVSVRRRGEAYTLIRGFTLNAKTCDLARRGLSVTSLLRILLYLTNISS